MCIRDSDSHARSDWSFYGLQQGVTFLELDVLFLEEFTNGCLLYTSDAADERSSVDLGGRRIIKKKKQQDIGGRIANVKQRVYSTSTQLRQSP